MMRRYNFHAWMAALFLCIVMLTGFFSVLEAAADTGAKFSGIVDFNSISLYYAGPDGRPEGEPLEDGILIEQNKQLVLSYTYEITEEQCEKIKADIPYYLEVSPHLRLGNLSGGSPLMIETGNGTQEQFGTIYADGSRAWVIFHNEEDSDKTVLSKYGELQGAYFYLDCKRTDTVPPDEMPLDGHKNLYAMKFENVGQLNFGYAENEPVTAKAQIDKNGIFQDRIITWTIQYTPWQNPAEGGDIAPDTPFELRDTIDDSLHSYVGNSVKIDGAAVTVYDSRDKVPDDAETYVIAETEGNNGSTVLSFGGKKFNAGQATQGNPAKPIEIRYQTSVNESLLLPGGSEGKVTNAAGLFAGKDGIFNALDIKCQSDVPVTQPEWVTKEGKTTRHTDGTGSTTDWTVTFNPNGFSFEDESELTLHDRLPDGSTLMPGSVQVNGIPAAAVPGENNSFTVSPITADGKSVTITYQTCVSEDMYESSTNLGSNTAWFTFLHGNNKYTTPEAASPVGSGDGSGTPGTAALVKSNAGYDATTRTIAWTVMINPHKAYLKGGTFTDDLKLGNDCGTDGHAKGLELAGNVNDIEVLINGKKPDSTEEPLVQLEYGQQKLIVKAGEIGAKTISFTYTTKVCDPCIFANNSKYTFENVISTDDMLIGKQAVAGRSASAGSKADVSPEVLVKMPPVYDYETGVMKWTVEVDAAGLPMKDVVLTDNLPAGHKYVEKSFAADPGTSGMSARAEGQMLTIDLGTVSKKTIVTFDTKIDPEILGFGTDKAVAVENTIYMNGSADGVTFSQVSHSVKQDFSNHGLVKSSNVNNKDELIRYEVLVNPFGVALPENPFLVDTLDKRLQLDPDTVRFYETKLTGTTVTNKEQSPGYEKIGEGKALSIADYDPEANRFKVELPIRGQSRDAYVLSYTADIIRRQTGGYGNSVRFEGGSVLLGGNKNNSASVSGGGGGGGGGVAARKAGITIIKTDSETKRPLSGVTFTLYQWDSVKNRRGLPFAKGATDAQGKLSFKVKPGASYEIAETESVSGYHPVFGWKELPEGVTKTDNGLLVTAGAVKTERILKLTNDAYTTDIVFRLVNKSGIPMTGTEVQLFSSNPANQPNLSPIRTATVLADGTVRFPDIRCGATYYIRTSGGEVIAVTVPADAGGGIMVKQPDGTLASLTENYQVIGSMPEMKQWVLTVTKVTGGSAAPLSGAAIGLYADADCRILIKKGVSDRDGILIFDGLMKGQAYWIKEISAPSGYRLSPRIYEGMETSPDITVANEPITSSKKPSEPGGAGISGGTGTSNRRSMPGGSQAAGRPGISEEHGEGSPEGRLSIPQTGDHTPGLAAIVFMSGFLLITMIAYRISGLKKRR